MHWEKGLTETDRVGNYDQAEYGQTVGDQRVAALVVSPIIRSFCSSHS